jgi:hypothetical protein
MTCVTATAGTRNKHSPKCHTPLGRDPDRTKSLAEPQRVVPGALDIVLALKPVCMMPSSQSDMTIRCWL